MQADSQRPLSQPSDEVSLRDLLGVLWDGRWLILSLSLFCAAAAGVAALVLPKKYEVSVLLSPVTSQSSAGASLGGLSSAASGLGGLAALAGLSLTNGSGAKAESIATLQSEALTESYIHDNNLLPLLFGNKWDRSLGRWRSSDPKKIPTLWKGNEYFKKNIRDLTENSKTGLVTLTITWTDAQLAAQWANGLVKMTNSYLRDKAISESERNITYLNDQAARTNTVEIRDAIYSLMESEIKKEMMARGSEEYALKVIDPAEPPERQSSPQLILWVLGGLFGGIFVSLLVTLIRANLRS